MSGMLFVVATPIGNLQDITYRAVETLKGCSIIVAEDTRETRKLLSHFGIHASLLTAHEHRELEAAQEVLGALKDGANVALVTDAGTPAISDPGAKFVAYLRQHGIRICPVPGPCSVVAALSVSGIPADRFYFGGFLPSKPKERLQVLQGLQPIPDTLVFLEAPHRLLEAINDLYAVLGDRSVFLAKELTKLHETLISTRLSMAFSALQGVMVKGEWVIIVEGASQGHAIHDEAKKQAALRLIEYLKAQEMGHQPFKKDLSRLLAGLTGLSRAWIYEQLLTEDTKE